MTSMPPEPDGFDIFSPEAVQSPYPVYENLRRFAPLYRDVSRDAWILSRYDDVAAALKLAASLSSRYASGETTLLGADPPHHTRIRAVVRAVLPAPGDLEERVRELADELLRALVVQGGGDVVKDFAERLPLQLVAEMLGIDTDRLNDLKVWADALVAAGEWRVGESNEERRRLDIALREFEEFAVSHVDKAAGTRTENVVTRLIQGGQLERREIVAVTKLLVVAGSDTTRHLIANAVLMLLARPNDAVSLRRQPHLIGDYIEEVLRYESPVQVTQRLCKVPVNLGGGVIPEGARVMLLIGSANRDPARFADAASFAPGQRRMGHIAFGLGPHFCLGAQFARLEARIALELMLGLDVRPVALTSVEAVPMRTFPTRGPQMLEIEFR
jgi:cytochrome P450